MEFKAGTQGGVQKPTEWKTKDSDFGLIVSNTVTIYGQTLVLKALSNAPMYKTTNVTFYSDWTNSVSTATHVLGTSTFVDNVAAILVVPDLAIGQNSIYAVWEGEGVYSSKTTKGVPIGVVVQSGEPIGGSLDLIITPPSNTVVVTEGNITMVAKFTTSTNISDNIRFYSDGVPIASIPLVNNSATIVVSDLSAGTHLLQASWPGAVIGGTRYQGMLAEQNYTILEGSQSDATLTIEIEPAFGVVLEGFISIRAELTGDRTFPGNISFYRDGVFLGTEVTTSGIATLSLSNNFTVGTHVITATWDGNQSSTPKYMPKSSNALTWTVVERDSVSGLSISVTPEPSVATVQDAVITATLSTSSAMTGVINFYSNRDYFIGSAMIQSNHAILHTNDLSTGTHLLTAQYSGSVVEPKFYPISSTSVTHEVTKGYVFPNTLTLTTDKNPASSVVPIHFTVANSAASTLTGLVTLTEVAQVNQSVISSTGTVTITNFEITWDTLESNPGFQRVSNVITEFVGFGGTRPSGAYNYPGYTHYIYCTGTQAVSVGEQIEISLVKSSQVYTQLKYPGPGTTTYKGYFNITDLASDKIYLAFIGGEDIFRHMVSRQVGAGDALNWNTQTAYLSTTTSIPNWVYYNGTTSVTVTGIRAGLITVPTSYSVTPVYQVLRSLGTTNFNGSSTASITISPNTLSSSTYLIRAEWDGGYMNGTPYTGTVTNTISQIVYAPALSLTSTDNPSVISSSTTFIAELSGNPVEGEIITYRKDGSAIGSITMNGNTSTLTVPNSLITLGAHAITAKIDTYGITSNTLTQNIITSQFPISKTLSFVGNPFNHYRVDGTINNYNTATLTLVSTFTNHYATGVVSLYDNTTNVLLGTATLSGAGSTSSASISWAPGSFNQLSQGTKTIRATYAGDDWNRTTSTTSSFVLNAKYPLSTPTMTYTRANVWSKLPVTVTAQFETGSKPTGLCRLYATTYDRNNNQNLGDVETLLTSAFADTTGKVTFNPVIIPGYEPRGDAGDQNPRIRITSQEDTKYLGTSVRFDDVIISSNKIKYWDDSHGGDAFSIPAASTSTPWTNTLANIVITNGLAGIPIQYTQGVTMTINYKVYWSTGPASSVGTLTLPITATTIPIPCQDRGVKPLQVNFDLIITGNSNYSGLTIPCYALETGGDTRSPNVGL